jgi:hypothetical protein
LAGLYYSHHWSCPNCRAGTLVGSKLHRPCAERNDLWARYCQTTAQETRA